VALDDPRTEIEGGEPPRACDELSVNDEQLVRNWHDIAIALKEIGQMIPAYAAFAAVEEPGFGERETTGPNAGYSDTFRGLCAKESQHFWMVRQAPVDQAANHHDIVELRGRIKRCPR